MPAYSFILVTHLLLAMALPGRSPINWQEPFEVDGIALGARKPLVLKLFGNPTQIRLSPPGTPWLPIATIQSQDVPCFIWDYADRRIKLCNEQVMGITGVELTQADEVRLRKGDSVESSQMALGDRVFRNVGPFQVFQFVRRVHLAFPGAIAECPASLAVTFKEKQVHGVCLYDAQYCSPDLNSPRGPTATVLPSLSSRYSKTVKVRFQTSKGEFFVDIYPEANKIAANRFLELVEAGFYNDTPFHNVVPGFKVRFGTNWREGFRDWRTRQLPVGPDEQGMTTLGGQLERYRLEPGTVSLEQNCRLTINYQDLTGEQPKWPPAIGRVTRGLDILESLTVVGDPEFGLDEQRLWNQGGEYLASLVQQPDSILKVEILH